MGRGIGASAATLAAAERGRVAARAPPSRGQSDARPVEPRDDASSDRSDESRMSDAAPSRPTRTDRRRGETALAFFQDRFELNDGSLGAALDTALERNVDYADLYFEYTTTDSVSLEEGIVKSGDRHLEQGVGVRAVRGERQGYAHSDEISLESARSPPAPPGRSPTNRPPACADRSRWAAKIAASTTSTRSPDGPDRRPGGAEGGLAGRDRPPMPARSDPKRPSRSWPASSASTSTCSWRAATARASPTPCPLVRLNIQVLAADGQPPRGGLPGCRWPLRARRASRDPVALAARSSTRRFASRCLNLEAEALPSGHRWTSCSGPGWPGILLARGDRAWPRGRLQPQEDLRLLRTSMGRRVAAEGVTVVDDGTLPEPARLAQRGRRRHARPSETSSSRTAILVGYMQDRLNAQLMGVDAPTGNGRRESYAHLPLPRMTNTFMLAGDEDPEEILRSVDNGLYAVSFGGGQVDITSGKFVFSASEAYRIEQGQIGAPVKGRHVDRQRSGRPDSGQPASDTTSPSTRASAPAARTARGSPSASACPTIRLDAIDGGRNRRLSAAQTSTQEAMRPGRRVAHSNASAQGRRPRGRCGARRRRRHREVAGAR